MNCECENCGFVPKTQKCVACSEDSPKWAKFCPHCGVAVSTSVVSEPSSAGGDPFAMENRRLCYDDNCIGILDGDGSCVVCGRKS